MFACATCVQIPGCVCVIVTDEWAFADFACLYLSLVSLRPPRNGLSRRYTSNASFVLPLSFRVNSSPRIVSTARHLEFVILPRLLIARKLASTLRPLRHSLLSLSTSLRTPASLARSGRPRRLRHPSPPLLAVRQRPTDHLPAPKRTSVRSRRMLERDRGVPRFVGRLAWGGARVGVGVGRWR